MKPKGFWARVADHGLGLLKGIGAGVLGGAVVGVDALIIGASTPILAAGAGAALLGGALYGLVVGNQNFSWTEAIVGSIIGGISSGVGSWLTTAGSALAAKIGVAATNLAAGGLTSLSSYLIHEPSPTLKGALGVFTIGSAVSGGFMAVGAAASRVWNWGSKAVAGLSGKAQSGTNPMVAAASEVPSVSTEALQSPWTVNSTGGSGSTGLVSSPVLGKTRVGSALKTDPHHAFPDIIDNYAGCGQHFPLVGGDGIERDLYQVEGSLNGESGIFEWIVDGDKVTHRRFIPGGHITGLPNQRPH